MFHDGQNAKTTPGSGSLSNPIPDQIIMSAEKKLGEAELPENQWAQLDSASRAAVVRAFIQTAYEVFKESRSRSRSDESSTGNNDDPASPAT